MVLYKIQCVDGTYLMREPGNEERKPLWDKFGIGLYFNNEKDAQAFADRFFTRKYVKVVKV